MGWVTLKDRWDHYDTTDKFLIDNEEKLRIFPTWDSWIIATSFGKLIRLRICSPSFRPFVKEIVIGIGEINLLNYRKDVTITVSDYDILNEFIERGTPWI